MESLLRESKSRECVSFAPICTPGLLLRLLRRFARQNEATWLRNCREGPLGWRMRDSLVSLIRNLFRGLRQLHRNISDILICTAGSESARTPFYGMKLLPQEKRALFGQ